MKRVRERERETVLKKETGQTSNVSASSALRSHVQWFFAGSWHGRSSKNALWTSKTRTHWADPNWSNPGRHCQSERENGNWAANEGTRWDGSMSKLRDSVVQI